jgi:hypothetical protein
MPEAVESETVEAGTPPTAQESATPAETTEAISAEAPPVGEEKPAEESPAGVTEDEADASETEEPSVKAQARKVWAEVNKMGGQPAFDAARDIFTKYIHDEPENFVAEIEQYGARFYPVRDVILSKTARDYPTDVINILKTVHPELSITVGKETKPEQPTGDAFDPLAYAREVLANEYATPEERAMAQHTLAVEERLGKLPELERKVTDFDEFQTQTKQQRVAAEQGKFVDELMETVVDKTYKESGLEAAGISQEVFRELVVAAHGKNPEANARFQQAMSAIAAGDMHTANLLKSQIKRDGEEIAFARAKPFTAGLTQRRNSKTDQINKERPTVVPTGQPVGARPPSATPAFDEQEWAQAWDDVKARV